MEAYLLLRWRHKFLVLIFCNFWIFYKGDYYYKDKQFNSMFRNNWAKTQNKMLSGIQNPTETRPVLLCSQSAHLGGDFHPAAEPNMKQVINSTKTAPSMPSPPLSTPHLWLSPKAHIVITPWAPEKKTESHIDVCARNGSIQKGRVTLTSARCTYPYLNKLWVLGN